MKKIILVSCLLGFSSFSALAENKEALASYQELCAKEQDPVKRQNYCYLLENSDHASSHYDLFRKDIAVV